MREKITRVLVVEDDPSWTIMKDRIIRQHNSEFTNYARTLLEGNSAFRLVGECQAGEDALLACAELSPDVVLLCQPKEMSQFEFVERFAKAYPSIGIAVARGSWGADDMCDMMLLGVRHILFSPFHIPYFYELLQHAKANPPFAQSK